MGGYSTDLGLISEKRGDSNQLQTRQLEVNRWRLWPLQFNLGRFDVPAQGLRGLESKRPALHVLKGLLSRICGRASSQDAFQVYDIEQRPPLRRSEIRTLFSCSV